MWKDKKPMPTNPYNENFAIPEMIKTFKALCSRLQKDLLFIGLIIAYVFFIHEFKFPSLELNLKYEGKNILLLLIIFLFLYFSVLVFLMKIFILYRQIDNEVKDFYSYSNKDFMQAIDCSSHMTAFVLSDNMISDFILSGTTRMPSLRRFIALFLIIYVLAVSLSYVMLNDYLLSYPRLVLLLLLIVLFSLIQYLAITKIFIVRSAFLYNADMWKQLILSYISILDRLNIEASGILLRSVLEPHSQMIKSKRELIGTSDLSCLFDVGWPVVRVYKKHISELNEAWNSLPLHAQNSADFKAIFDQLDIKPNNRTSAQNTINSISDTLKYLDRQIQNISPSNFLVAFKYHEKNSNKEPNNFFSFLWYGLTR